MSIGSFFRKLANFFGSAKVRTALETVSQLVPVVLPIVRAIAALTPTRADDQIVAVFERYDLPGVATLLALPPEQRYLAITHAATAAALPYAPAGTERKAVRAAVEMAYIIAEAQK